MNRVDATPLVGEKAEPEKVPVKHLRWWDRSRCTVPEVKLPADASWEDWGEHVSTDLNSTPHVPSGEVRLEKHGSGGPAWLMGDGVMLALSSLRPLLWAIVDEYADLRLQYGAPRLKSDRADAEAKVYGRNEARS